MQVLSVAQRHTVRVGVDRSVGVGRTLSHGKIRARKINTRSIDCATAVGWRGATESTFGRIHRLCLYGKITTVVAPPAAESFA